MKESADLDNYSRRGKRRLEIIERKHLKLFNTTTKRKKRGR